MNYRKFNRTGFNTSEVGLGCWQLGSEWGEVSDKKAVAILETAFESGINFYDTADVYGAGRSEKFIGEFLKRHADNLFIATKVGRDGSLYPDKYSEKGVQNCIEDSLKRLGMKALDLVQLHCVPELLLQQGDIFDWMRRLKTEGKIKEYGVSVESMKEAQLCLEQDDICSLQIIFNIFRQKPAEKILSQAKAKNVAIIVRLPLASGLLTGKFNRDSSFPEDDHRNFNRDGQAFNVGETFAGLPFEKGVVLADRLKSVLPEGMNLVQLALRWILDFDEVSVIIPGASRPEQVKQNSEISDMPALDQSLHQKLTDFYINEVHGHIRGPY